jgi:U3 small nucleolar RNA-associated protein 19
VVKQLRKASLGQWTPEHSKQLGELVRTLCSATECCQRNIRSLRDLVQPPLVQAHVILTLNKLLNQTVKERKKDITPLFKRNVLCFLEMTKLSKPKAADESGEGDYEASRRVFSQLWERFLLLELDFEMYKRVLIILNEQVMPHLARPLLLTDFLISSYNVGGAISILALDGVFTLVQKYNLEYPDFYTKLYALFQPEVLHSRYRARFFYMANIFLQSTHLPEYLVAAFAKRLSRIALMAPANALAVVFPFIGNLLIRHPGLVGMIGRASGSGTAAMATDPYINEEPDPSKCKAIESSLWEIQSLQSHVLPQVSSAAKFISKRLPDMEWNLADYLDLSMEDMMRIERKKKAFVNVPLTFERPAGLCFAKNDVASKCFEFS